MSSRPNVTRRQFIAGAAAAAAGAAFGFPTIVPRSALGDDKQAPANSRLNLAFIGVGKMGWNHVDRMLGTRDVQVVTICDVHSLRRENARKVVNKRYADLKRANYAGCDGTDDFHQVLARKDVDAVVIATPDHWHTAVLIEAAKAKKDIYCEKPLTLTIAEAKAAIDAVRKTNVVFQTGSQQRSDGPFHEAVKLVQSGRLGTIKEVHVALGGATSIPCDLPAEPTLEGLNWERWMGPTPARPYNEVLCRKGLPDSYPFNPGWREYREYSGGYITDWGAHHIDITQWALSMDGSGPSEILPPDQAGAKYGGRLVYRDSPAGKEIVMTHVETIDLTGMSGAPAPAAGKKKGSDKGEKNQKSDKILERNGILFIGDKGKLFVNRGTKSSEMAQMLGDAPDSVSEPKKKGNTHYDNFFECIRTRQRPICDVHIGAGSVTACHLLNLGYWHGRKLKWDPKAWEFPGDAEANAWRDRPRREGYPLPTA